MSDSYKVYASKEYVDNKIEESRAQPNWNQNDPTAVDYVKNRTHYAETSVVELLPEMSVDNSSENGGVYWSVTPIPVGISKGQTYDVVFNGVEYRCTGVDDGYGSVALGNFAVVGGTPDTGEPFFIGLTGVGDCDVGTRTPGTNTIKIFAVEETVHTIDPKFLPAGPNTKLLIITTNTSLMAASANLSYDEIKTALDNGDSIVGCEIQLGDSAIKCNNINGVDMYEDHITVMCMLYYNFYSDGRIEIID